MSSTRAKRIIDSAPAQSRKSAALMARPPSACASVALPTFPSAVAANSSRSELLLRREQKKKKAALLAKSSDLFTDPIVTTPPPEEPPVLLLEGDKYFISEDGVARTLYRTNDLQSPISVEEVFDIKHARKRFVVRSNKYYTPSGLSSNAAGEIQVNTNTKDNQATMLKGYVTSGHEISSVDLKEVDDGIFGGAGTGSTTWESSIVMSMIFSAHPELLYGDVIELGSGVGLGGILNALGPYSTFSTEMTSMTLTDCSPQVLEQCASNVTNSSSTTNNGMMGHRVPIRVENLDWYDFLRNNNNKSQQQQQQHSGKYDTIIACDCAYMYPDIEALTQTMISLIRRGGNNNSRSRIHIFGPHDRGGLHELLRQLRLQQDLFKVEVHPIDMQRYRLMPTITTNSEKRFGIQQDDNAFPFATKSDSTFLHIICTPNQTQSTWPSMFELD